MDERGRVPEGPAGESNADGNILARVQRRLGVLNEELQSREGTLDLLFLAFLLETATFGYFTFGPVTIDVRVVEDLVRRTTARRSSAATSEKPAYSDDALRFFRAVTDEVETSERRRIDERHLLLAFMKVGEGVPGRVFSELGVSAESVGNFVPNASATDSRRLYSPEEAAEYLGVHVKTVRNWIRSGLLPASRLAGQRVLRIRSADLEQLLEPVRRGDVED